MKRITTHIAPLFAILMLSSCASLYLDNGKAAYDELKYQDAITNLEKGLAKKSNTEGRLILADAYMKTNEFEKAMQTYREATIDPGVTDNQRLDFGRALMTNEDYDEARAVFEGILSRSPSNEIAQNLAHACRNAESMKADSALYTIEPFNVPGLSGVFAPVEYNNGLLVSGTAAAGLNKDPYTGESYIDLYFYENVNGIWKSATKLDGVNGKWHDGIATLSSDEKTMILTRSNYSGKSGLKSDEEHTNNTQLYISEKNEEGDWSEPVLVPFSDDKYMFAHPALSEDGQTLYFSSDMSPSKGGMDLFQVSKENGEWGTPKSLPSKINTAADEVFPHLKSADSLFYSSDGIAGLGGLDLHYTVLRDGNWSDPAHLGYPLNSSGDDFGVSFNEGGETGYLSSDRSGSDQLYSFAISSPEIALDGLITDVDNLKPIEGVKVIINNLTDGTVETLVSDENGRYYLDLLPGKDYKIQTDHVDYFSVSENVSTKGITSSEEKDLVFELKKLIITDTADNGDTDGNGNAGDGIGDNDGDGTDGNDGDGTGDGDNNGSDSAKNGVYDIPNIYWDYNKWEIRPDAEPYLNQLVKTLKDNPNLKVQVQSHCDSRGSYFFNDQLSEKRAGAVVDYIVGKGISRSLITSKGFGKRKLVNNCRENVECSESEHQKNRRTEFIVTERISK